MSERVIDTLDRMHKDGSLEKLISANILSPSVSLWREAYHAYISELEKEDSKMQALANVADQTGFKDRMIYYIRDKMEM